MPVTIYNSLTKKKEPLIPLDPDGKTLRMYSCGVTVYDRCHIGHARSLYIFDVIRRYLTFRGYNLRFVRNITDVDDKIINRAIELGLSSHQVSEENIRAYYEDLDALGVARADHEPRATDAENISEMIRYIEGLIAKGLAYNSDGDVYFRVRAFPSYGRLSGQGVDKMLEAVRIDEDRKKSDPLDFALWKKSKEGEPAWPSPWGEGRPGWHIECSCMSLKHLQCETLDIHAGGRDLIFPHHENEIAQAEGFTGRPFARYWIHHGLLTIDGQKMSKSLGNFITVQDALKRYPVDTLKMFFLSSHYASPIDFTDEKMSESHKAMQRFDVLFWKAAQVVDRRQPGAIPCTADFVIAGKRDFVEAMDDDFNTPRALAVLFQMINETHKFMDAGPSQANYTETIICAVDTIEQLARAVFGLFAREPVVQLSPEEERLLEERKQARKNKDFRRSDELRDLLKASGIIVEDSRDGQTWRKA